MWPTEDWTVLHDLCARRRENDANRAFCHINSQHSWSQIRTGRFCVWGCLSCLHHSLLESSIQRASGTNRTYLFLLDCLLRYIGLSFPCYRAMLCIARTMLSKAICPSVYLFVCMSHAGILSRRLNTASNFFSPSGSHTILVIPYQTLWQYSDGDPREGRPGELPVDPPVECRGYEKLEIFDQYIALSRKRCKIRP